MEIQEKRGMKLLHVRVAYNILDVIGDLGGVQDLFIFFFGLFFFSMSEHSFYVKTMNTLFRA